jgi:hypothetical protein
VGELLSNLPGLRSLTNIDLPVMAQVSGLPEARALKSLLVGKTAWVRIPLSSAEVHPFFFAIWRHEGGLLR